MNILAPFYSGDVVLMGIFSIMILISVHNWCIAMFKFYMIKKQKKLDKVEIEVIKSSIDKKIQFYYFMHSKKL